MWKVRFTKQAEKQIRSLIKEGVFSDMDRQVIGDWIRTVELEGPEALQDKKNLFNDHTLEGEWLGYRASAYSGAERIIYRVVDDKIVVVVVRITPTHDYKKDD